MTRRLGSAFSSLGRRPVLSAALIYLALSILLVLPGLLPGKTLSNSDTLWFSPPWDASRPAQLSRPSNIELADAPAQLQPFAQYAASRLPHIPLWNPYIDSGRPFLANAQSAIFSPYSVPAYVLNFWTALGWTAVLKFWVASFGMFLLGRALGMRFGGALMAGIVYGFNLWMVTWVTYPHMSVWTWIPWMLLLTERLVRAPDLLALGGLSAVTAVQFLGGHPESSFHLLVATVLFFILRLVQARRAGAPTARPIGRPILLFGGGLLGGAMIAALVLLPVGQLILNSADIHQRAGVAVDKPGVPAKFLLGLFLPDYWGRPTQTPLVLFLLSHAFYAGALPLMLAVAAVVLRPRPERVWIALFGATGLAVVVGLPPFLQIVTRLPVFSSGHNGRLVIWYMLAISLLAGWGVDDVAARVGSPSRRRIVLGASGALFVAPLLWVLAARRIVGFPLGRALDVAWGFAREPSTFFVPANAYVIRLASLLVWLPLAALALALLVLRSRGRMGMTPFVALAALLVVGDLFRAGMGYNPAIPTRYASQPATPAIRYLQSQRPARFVTDAADVPANVIPMRFGLYEARGYDLPVMRRYDRLWRSQIEPQYPSQVGPYPIAVPLIALPHVDAQGLRTLRLLGVSDILQSRSQPLLHLPGVHLVYQGRDARVYHVTGALPRVFVAGAQQVVNGDGAALGAVTHPGFDARAQGVVVTEQRLAGVPQSASGPAAPAGTAKLISYAPEQVAVRATVERHRGVLVLDDNWDPGWTATVDGHPVPVSRVDYVFRAVPLRPGTHTIEFRYRPLTWTVGWLLSVTSLLGLALLLLVGWRRQVASAARPDRGVVAAERPLPHQ